MTLQFLVGRDVEGPLFAELSRSLRENVRLWTQGAAGGATTSTTYGFVLDDVCELTLASSRHSLSRGCYFAVSGEFRVHGGRGLLIEVPEYAGLNVVGGPVEPTGRLKYIDGCTDTLLIPPPRLGDPCLNALYFPPGIDQTPHTHPSVRLGAVMWGHGVCETESGSFSLQPGLTFCIPPDLTHSFHTHEVELGVVAYHPDSDFGPQDEDHPMVNRTIVDGVSARHLPDIRTL